MKKVLFTICLCLCLILTGCNNKNENKKNIVICTKTETLSYNDLDLIKKDLGKTVLYIEDKEKRQEETERKSRIIVGKVVTEEITEFNEDGTIIEKEFKKKQENLHMKI